MVKDDHEIDCHLIRDSLVNGLPIPCDKSSLSSLHPSKADFLKSTKNRLGIKNGLEGLIGYVENGKADSLRLSECLENGSFIYPLTGQTLNFGILTMADKLPNDQKRTA